MTEEQLQLIEKLCKIDTTEKVTYPPLALSFGNKVIKSKKGNNVVDIPIGSLGNFSFIQAPPKSKKTFFVSLLVSAYLKSNEYVGKIKSHRNGEQVLHFDTEQGKYHASLCFQRITEMCGGTFGYHPYFLRTLKYDQRIEFIEHSLKNHKKTGLVVIDGLADLVADVNDIEQSNNCVQKLMKWSSDFNCHIITVIHSNFGTEKPTGHLGSFLEKKAETQISLEKNTVHEHEVIVTCKRSRGFPFNTFSFKINNFGYPQLVDTIYDPLKDT